MTMNIKTTGRSATMANANLGTALITGASSGIGATYADRLAHRGHNLILVARDTARMETLAARLRASTGVTIDIITADLTDAAQLATVEKRLRDDTKINLLINNAGAALPPGFLSSDADKAEWLIKLNITAPTRLTRAAAGRLAETGGAIVNISSVLAVAPEFLPGIYPATKSYILTLSQALQAELGPKGLYVQAVLPAATRTEIWERSGLPIENIQGVMEVGELVDAALTGFDRREGITIPPLPDAADWDRFEAARQALLPHFRQEHAAARYRKAA
jgi:short-subunit dehydrogenase